MKRLFLTLTILLALSGGLLASGTNTETFNKIHGVNYPAASDINPWDGYWNKSSSVTKVYVNYYPTGRAYTFLIDVDSANTVARTGANFLPANVDIPMFPHFGAIGSYFISVVDTGTSLYSESDDSLHVLLQLRAIAPETTADSTLDTLWNSVGGPNIIIQTLLDSATENSSLEIDKTKTAVAGVTGIWWQPSTGTPYPRNGEIDLATEGEWYERLQVFAMTAGADADNRAHVTLELRLFLPYCTAYMNSDYYLKNQRVK